MQDETNGKSIRPSLRVGTRNSGVLFIYPAIILTHLFHLVFRVRCENRNLEFCRSPASR